jgi:hypothetical protein
MKHAGLILLLLTAIALAACEEKKPYQPPLPQTGTEPASADKPLEAAGRNREQAAEKAGR